MRGWGNHTLHGGSGDGCQLFCRGPEGNWGDRLEEGRRDRGGGGYGRGRGEKQGGFTHTLHFTSNQMYHSETPMSDKLL